jgi:hypothetical protein
MMLVLACAAHLRVDAIFSYISISTWAIIMAEILKNQCDNAPPGSSTLEDEPYDRKTENTKERCKTWTNSNGRARGQGGTRPYGC